MTTEPGALAAGDQAITVFQRILDSFVGGVNPAGDPTIDVGTMIQALTGFDQKQPGGIPAIAACAIVRLARQEAEIRADERRKVVAEIVAEFKEHLTWQRDTGCHEMRGTPEIGRYIGWEDALAEVRKHAEVAGAAIPTQQAQP